MILAVVFLAAIALGAGPGIWLVNRPQVVTLPGGLSLPLLYAWGLLWYAVEAACVVLAYVLVWRSSGDDLWRSSGDDAVWRSSGDDAVWRSSGDDAVWRSSGDDGERT